ncbi:MAG: hypothetical protein SGCHY_000476 [Lobulomycetales sp.]
MCGILLTLPNRKALSKSGLIAVPEVTRVAIRRSKNVLFVVARPDVFRNPNGDIYVVFGEIKGEDMASQAQANAAQQFQQTMPSAAAVTESASDDAPPALEEVDESVDETGVESKDIELVMQQAGVTRAKAVKALRDSDNDIVSAIMELTI